jgi:hypothetical protein
MLWDRGQPLVEEEFEAEMVGAHHELATPEVRAPMMYRLHQSDELVFIDGEFGMVGSDMATEEGDGADLLV